MDIELAMTPPKKATRNDEQYSTPTKKTTPVDCYQTPCKKSSHRKMESSPAPKEQFSTPNKKENPQSRKMKQARGGTNKKTPGSSKKTPGSSKKKVAQFNLSRLEQDYHFQRTLGEGNFSSVGLYRSQMTGELFAIKITKLSTMSINQAQALGTLSIFSQSSKNIVRYFYSWVQNNQIYIVMQFCNHNLTSKINQRRQSKKGFSETEIKQILKQSLQGLKGMHEHKMVHLDIKSDNLLFKDSILKISDLGLTRISRLKRQSDLQQGDSRYLAKQLLNYNPSIDLTKSDIFSLGMTMYQAMTLQNLPNNGQVWQNIRNNGLFLSQRMDLQEYTPQLLQIIEKMTRPDWRDRPSATEILKHSYFKQSLSRRSRMFAQNQFMNNKLKFLDKQNERKKESSL